MLEDVSQGKNFKIALTVVSKECLEKRKVTYEIASNSKAFTALAILLLDSQGHLNIKDNISEYLPMGWNFKMNGKKVDISILQLLNHTSGLPGNTYKFMSSCEKKDSLKSIAEKVINEPIIEEPGSIFKYTTASYCLLGYLIECISGKSYHQFMEMSIFKPLGLKNTYATLSKAQNMISGTQRKLWYRKEIIKPYYEFAPAGFLYSTPEDMSKWIKIQLGISKVSEEFKAIIKQSQDELYYAKTEKNKVYYGFGWYKNIDENVYYHDGMNPFFSSYVMFSKNIDSGVCILNNNLSSKTSLIAKKTFKVVKGEKEDSKISKRDKEDKKDLTFKVYLIIEMIILIKLLLNLDYLMIVDFLIAIFISKISVKSFWEYEYWKNIKVWILDSMRYFFFTTVLLLISLFHLAGNYLVDLVLN
nr:serine hydrolase domain-containing protein [Anaeromonas gelatinilytica]